MRVRLAQKSDLSQILDILNREILEGVAHFGTEPQSVEELRCAMEGAGDRFPWFVAVEGADQRVIGFARCSPWKSRGAYAWTVEVGVYVRPECQGQGVGKAIYERFIPALRDRGFRTVLAGIGLPNEPSVRLHENFGFRHVGTLPRAGWKQGKWHDVGYWALNFGEEDEPPEPAGGSSRAQPD